jgi:hypothetical protein
MACRIVGSFNSKSPVGKTVQFGRLLQHRSVRRRDLEYRRLQWQCSSGGASLPTKLWRVAAIANSYRNCDCDLNTGGDSNSDRYRYAYGHCDSDDGPQCYRYCYRSANGYRHRHSYSKV